METLFALLSAVAAIISAGVAWYAVYKANEQARDQLRPIVVWDGMDTALLTGGPPEDHVGDMPSVIFRGWRNDGSGPALNMMVVVEFTKWTPAQTIQFYLGYLPHGRDYARKEQVYYLSEKLRDRFRSLTATQLVPNVLVYYSDVFGRRFVTKALWQKHVSDGPEELSDLRLEFLQVGKKDHLFLPGNEQGGEYVVRPMTGPTSRIVKIPDA